MEEMEEMVAIHVQDMVKLGVQALVLHQTDAEEGAEVPDSNLLILLL